MPPNQSNAGPSNAMTAPIQRTVPEHGSCHESAIRLSLQNTRRTGVRARLVEQRLLALSKTPAPAIASFVSLEVDHSSRSRGTAVAATRSPTWVGWGGDGMQAPHANFLLSVALFALFGCGGGSSKSTALPSNDDGGGTTPESNVGEAPPSTAARAIPPVVQR